MKFFKMSGSGNDFVFIDGIGQPEQTSVALDPDFVRTVCAPHTGVGADGLAVLLPDDELEFSLAYFNRDGSVGELCGNASLCAVRLSNELGLAQQSGLRFRTPAGIITGRLRDGRPEVDLQAVQGLRSDAGIPRQAGEQALGFADSGVPHLVVRAHRVDGVPLATRGPELRHHASLPAGANVNWVAQDALGSWEIRTYERGVEDETLACGTGAVAAAALLQAWGESGDSTTLRTKSGQPLQVNLRSVDGQTVPTLAGEGRIVFEGTIREL
jgi:diaminopimelate epimerase